jgi:hypothetical protein
MRTLLQDFNPCLGDRTLSNFRARPERRTATKPAPGRLPPSPLGRAVLRRRPDVLPLLLPAGRGKTRSAFEAFLFQNPRNKAALRAALQDAIALAKALGVRELGANRNCRGGGVGQIAEKIPAIQNPLVIASPVASAAVPTSRESAERREEFSFVGRWRRHLLLDKLNGSRKPSPSAAARHPQHPFPPAPTPHP